MGTKTSQITSLKNVYWTQKIRFGNMHFDKRLCYNQKLMLLFCSLCRRLCPVLPICYYPLSRYILRRFNIQFPRTGVVVLISLWHRHMIEEFLCPYVIKPSQGLLSSVLGWQDILSILHTDLWSKDYCSLQYTIHQVIVTNGPRSTTRERNWQYDINGLEIWILRQDCSRYFLFRFSV